MKKRPAKKMISEKATGERYKSRSAMKRHEKSEGPRERKREYGSKKGR